MVSSSFTPSVPARCRTARGLFRGFGFGAPLLRSFMKFFLHMPTWGAHMGRIQNSHHLQQTWSNYAVYPFIRVPETFVFCNIPILNQSNESLAHNIGNCFLHPTSALVYRLGESNFMGARYLRAGCNIERLRPRLLNHLLPPAPSRSPFRRPCIQVTSLSTRPQPKAIPACSSSTPNCT